MAPPLLLIKASEEPVKSLHYIMSGAVLSMGLILWGASHFGSQDPFRSEQSVSSSSEANSKSNDKSSRTQELGEAKGKTSDLDYESSVALNDPALHQAWGFKKSDAMKAQSISQGSRKLVVAVIDTGADLRHEDLAQNLWKNSGELGLDSKGRDKAINQVDDDNNGYVDDVHGWNFVSENHDLADNHGHGSHIAGIIGAQAGNGKGIAGVSPQVSLMILKYFDPKVPNTDNLRNTVNSIRYAIKNKAHIINYSGGGTEFSAEEKQAIEEARRNGILFVAAAGNERSNSDQHKYYPADYGLDNIISVTAIDQKTEVLPSSNYGVETVDLAAPGHNILSTLPGNSYGYMTGTSQATAFVTGAAVLVKAHHPEFTAYDIKKYILATGDANAALLAKTRTARRLNLYKALTMLDGGLTASGIVAENTRGQGQKYTMESSNGFESAAKIATFGKSLMQAVGTEGKEIPKRLGEN